jgi:hypothetical protein
MMKNFSPASSPTHNFAGRGPSSSFDVNPALDSPQHPPRPNGDDPLSPPLTALSLADGGFALGEESADSISMIELSNYIPPADQLPPGGRRAFGPSDAYEGKAASAQRLSSEDGDPCHRRFGRYLPATSELPARSSTLEMLMEGDWSWHSDASGPGLKAYDEREGGNLCGFLQLAADSRASSPEATRALRVLEECHSPPPSSPPIPFDPASPFAHFSEPLSVPFPERLTQWATLLSAGRMLQANLRHLLSHVAARRKLMEEAGRELERRRARGDAGGPELDDAEVEERPDPLCLSTVGAPASDPVKPAAGSAFTSPPSSEPYFDQSDPSLQAAIFNSLEEAAAAGDDPLSVINALGHAPPGGQLDRAIKGPPPPPPPPPFLPPTLTPPTPERAAPETLRL